MVESATKCCSRKPKVLRKTSKSRPPSKSTFALLSVGLGTCTEVGIESPAHAGILGKFSEYHQISSLSLHLLPSLYITTYILISPLRRVIRTYVIILATLSILVITLKTNNFRNIPRYTLNLSSNPYLS